MKKFINKNLAKFGYKISRTSTKISSSNTNTNINTDSNTDAYKMQKHLIKDSNSELTIFDVGAYVGGIALKYNKLFPKSKIFCFEPFPDSFSTLERNTASFKNITSINKGLSEMEGISKFQTNTSAPTNSIFKTDKSRKNVWSEGLLETIATVEVEMTTLDNFVAAHAIEKIDILKMDVQGAEFMVLNGAKNTFEKGIVNMIYTEIIMLPTYEGQIPFEETVKLIRSFGFELFNFYNYSLTKEGQLRQVDAIFIKTNSNT